MPISGAALVVVVTAVVTVTTLFVAAIGVLLDHVAASDDGEDADRG